jgi:hypothetical protein
MCLAVQGAPQWPQMCRRGQCLLVLGPSNSRSGSNGSRNMAARAARPTQGVGASGMGPPLDNSRALLPPATGVCAMGHRHRVTSITRSDPTRGRVDTTAAPIGVAVTTGGSGPGRPGGRSPPVAAGRPTRPAVRAAATGQARLPGLTAQLIPVLLGQRGAEARMLHDDPSIPCWAALSGTVGVRPQATPQVKTLGFGRRRTLFVGAQPI